MIQVYKGITYRKAKKLAETWKYRQSCNNQPEQNDIAKAKAHIYGICAEELLESLKHKLPDNKSVLLDGRDMCRLCGSALNNGKCVSGCGYQPDSPATDL